MVVYKCRQCDKEFDRKSNYVSHQNRQKKCTSKNTILHQNNTIKKYNNEQEINTLTLEITPNNKKWFCKYCHKQFARNWTLLRHLEERCKVKKEQDNNKEVILQEIIQELKELKEKNKVLEENNKNLEKKINKINKEVLFIIFRII